MKVVVIASTRGSILSRVLRLPYIKERISAVVSDRMCGAIDVARENRIPGQVFAVKSALEFSDRLLEEYWQEPPDLFLSFYTKLFRGRFVNVFEGRLLNFHPSILPACPGMDGFGDTVRSGSTFIGATVHFVDKGMDSGYPVLQSAIPFNPEVDIEVARHQVFVSQCRMFIQIVQWFESSRVIYRKGQRPKVLNGKYSPCEFSPNLDFDLALNFQVALGK